MLRREDILAYVKDKYQTPPERPWSKFPHYIVLRHKNHARWYGILMTAPRAKLGLEGAGGADIIDLKAGADLTELLRGNGGILPAYHMNKEHWLSIVLNGSVPDNDICALIDKSYSLTA